jgi:nicotinamidase/pyrazinamidase
MYYDLGETVAPTTTPGAVAPGVTPASGSALLLVDVQDCFLDANTTSGKPGSLAVTASQILPKINALKAKECLFDEVIKSQDFHPAGHISFSSTHGLPLWNPDSVELRCLKPTGATGALADAACCPTKATAIFNTTGNAACTTCAGDSLPEECFVQQQSLWPDHCLQGDAGDSTFPPSLVEFTGQKIVQKGQYQNVDAYSAFMDNTKTLKTDLDDTLTAGGIKTLYIAGIATDFCVLWTAEDAVALGYEVYLLTDAIAGIFPSGVAKALSDLQDKGVKMTTTEKLLECSCSNATCNPSVDVTELTYAPTSAPTETPNTKVGSGSGSDLPSSAATVNSTVIKDVTPEPSSAATVLSTVAMVLVATVAALF